MKINENEQQLNKKFEQNINKIAEKIYQSIAGSLPDIDTSTGHESYLPAKKIDDFLNQTSFYSPVQTGKELKKKNSKAKITMDDINKIRSATKNKDSQKINVKKGRIASRTKTIV